MICRCVLGVDGKVPHLCTQQKVDRPYIHIQIAILKQEKSMMASRIKIVVKIVVTQQM